MATVFELHEEQEPLHATAPSFSLVTSSTPVKKTSHNARSERKADVTELLWSEMRNGGWVRDNRVLQRFGTPSLADATSRSITVPETVDKEEDLYQPLVDYVNAFTAGDASSLQFINSSRYIPKQSHKDSHSTQDEPASGKVDPQKSLVKPNLLGMLPVDAQAFKASAEKKDNTWLYWRSVRVVCEVKKTSTARDWLGAREQAAMYARQVLRNDPSRRFIYGIVWCHPSFEIWLYDPSGSVVSDQQAFFTTTGRGKATILTPNTTACALLARIVRTLSQFNSAKMGYDPAFVIPRVNPSLGPSARAPYAGATIAFPATEHHPAETFILECELFARGSLRGRRTRIWLVARSSDHKRFILKDSWRDSARTPEWIWYEQVAAKEHLPKLYRFGTVTIDGEDDTTELCRGICGITDCNGTPLTQVEHRIHDRLLFDTHGVPSTDYDDYAELLLAVRGAVQAHRTLSDAGILHRDVSVNNILIDVSDRSGILIDLDLAAKVDRDGGVSSHFRSGTLLFMASEVIAGMYLDQTLEDDELPEFRHAVVHDLESFVWVLLYIAVSVPGYDEARKHFWASVPGDDLKKYIFWTNTTRGWRMMGQLLRQHPLWEPINSLHSAVEHCRKTSPVDRPAQYAALYEQFLTILAAAASQAESEPEKNRKRVLSGDGATLKAKRFKSTVAHIPTPRENPDAEEAMD